MQRLEAVLARGLLRLMRALGPVRASNVAGAFTAFIGPKLPISRRIDANLNLAMPELDPAERRRIKRGVWENLGRTVGEFPFIGQLGPTASGPGYEVVGAENVQDLVRQSGPAILFTAHIGNWEVMPAVTAAQGVRLATLYRPANNPAIDSIIFDLRRAAVGADAPFFPKGTQGARQALVHLKRGGHLGLLQDQKLNDGIESRFFGRPAMTAPALAVLALRLRCPVLPAYSRRIGPARFRVFFEPPLPLPDTGNREADVAALTQAVNDHLEGWIRGWPEGWLWLHRRWPKNG